MSDNEITEMWREHRQAGQAKRASNRAESARLLIEAEIPFEEKNGGAHLIITVSEHETIDFWPGTGLWISRANKERQRGVRRLINHVRTKRIIHCDLADVEKRVAAQLGDESQLDERDMETVESINDANADEPIDPPWD